MGLFLVEYSIKSLLIWLCAQKHKFTMSLSTLYITTYTHITVHNPTNALSRAMRTAVMVIYRMDIYIHTYECMNIGMVCRDKNLSSKFIKCCKLPSTEQTSSELLIRWRVICISDNGLVYMLHNSHSYIHMYLHSYMYTYSHSYTYICIYSQLYTNTTNRHS